MNFSSSAFLVGTAFEVSCHLLMSINCCSKIFIYLLLSKDYWTSLRSLKNCFQCSTAPGEVKIENFTLRVRELLIFEYDPALQQIVQTSKHLFPSTKADVESLLNYSLNKKRYCSEIPPEARHQQCSLPRIHKLSVSSHTTNSSSTPRMSLLEGIEMKQRERNQITLAAIERHPSTRSARSCRTLPLSPSQTSLARSKSLNIQSTMKHSPNCRLNKKLSNWVVGWIVNRLGSIGWILSAELHKFSWNILRHHQKAIQRRRWSVPAQRNCCWGKRAFRKI